MGVTHEKLTVSRIERHIDETLKSLNIELKLLKKDEVKNALAIIKLEGKIDATASIGNFIFVQEDMYYAQSTTIHFQDKE